MSNEDDARSTMIMAMERTFNVAWFKQRTNASDKLSTLSTSQYWDWLTYVDVSPFLLSNANLCSG